MAQYRDPEMERIQKEVESWTKGALKKRRPKVVHIGTNTLNDRKIFVDDDQRAIHMHVLGRSGQGKTYFLEHMIRSDIDNRRGVCLIDPHGDLYERVLRYCVRKRLKDRVILIDPSDTNWAVGLNYLEYNPDIYDETAHTSRVMKGIAKAFGGENTEMMPELQRWERNALVPLVRSKMTLIELFHFISTVDSTFRDRIVEEVDNPYLAIEWEQFTDAIKRERNLFIRSVQNRANKFVINKKIRRIFGQQVSTVDFRKAMDEQKIILCNLNSGTMPDEEWKMIGVVIIDKMYEAGMSRIDIPESKRKRLPPFYFYIDEFAELVSDDIAKALKDLRKFKVSLILAHQELEQLREESPKLYSAVMAEPDIKLTFSIGRDDAEIMAKSIFTGKFRGDVEKRVIKQTKFEPIESTRTVRGQTTGSSSAYGDTIGGGNAHSSISSVAQAYLPDEGFFGGAMTGVTRSSGSTSSQSDNWSQSTTNTDSWGESVTEVPFYEYRKFMEVSGVQDFTIEELREKFIAWIMNQSPRRAQLKIGTRNPMPIETPAVSDIRVRQKDIDAFKEQVYQRYARPVAEVDREIEERVPKFMKLVAATTPAVEAGTHEEMRSETMNEKRKKVRAKDLFVDEPEE